MSRRKQGSKPQHRSELSREDEKADEDRGVELAMPPRLDAPNQDLLTCGQCGRRFLLRRILDFIEHKKSDCGRPPRLRELPGGPHSPLAARQLVTEREDPRAVGVSDVTSEDIPDGDEMEPTCYICTSCKEPFPSAWLLLQHAQYSHSLHIFLELDPTGTPPPPSNIENPANSSSPPPPEDGSPFELPRASETPFRSRSPSGPLLFATPLHCPPDQSDSGSEETGPPSALGRAAGRGLPDFSRRLRTLAGGPGPSRRNHHHRLSAFLSGHPSAGNTGSSRQRSPHGRSKDCEFCGKTFKFPSNLVVHRRSHTGEKPYRCPFCEHACSQSSKLKRHMKTHAGLFNGWPPSTGALSGKTSKDQALHRRRYADEHSGQQDPGASSALPDQEEFGLKIKVLKVEPDSGEEPQAGGPTEQSDSEGHGPPSDSDHLHGIDELANGEAERPSASPPPPGLANGFGFHAKRLLGPPLGPSLLRAPLKPVKAEPGLPLEEAGSNFYSRWLADCAASRQPPPPSSSSPSPAPRASPASENSGENNGDSCSSTPPRDVSADSGTASGHSTPKRAGGTGEEGRWRGGEARRRNACEFCGKIFRNASNLTVHRRSHTGERPYRCELCPYACTQSSKLTRHMKTHIQPGKEVFRCHTCNIPFSIYSTLEKHIKKRHSEQLQEPQPID